MRNNGDQIKVSFCGAEEVWTFKSLGHLRVWRRPCGRFVDDLELRLSLAFTILEDPHVAAPTTG